MLFVPKITQQQIIKKYAYMFKDRNPNGAISMFGFECGEGWNLLLDKLMSKISRIDKDKEVRVEQIKEKFGSLRFYISSGPDEVYKAIEDAEKESFRTCEECGRPGRLRNYGWYKTLCDRCETARPRR